MKLTLLELTQMIMSSMDSDEINSIADTAESQQVANIIKETYFDIIGRMNAPEHQSLFEMEASGSATYPTIMFLPSDVQRVDWIKYDNDDGTSATPTPYYLPVRFQERDTFFEMMYALDADTSTVDTATYTLNGDSIPLLWENDKFPQWYTHIDDYILLFDSYDSSVDSTLTKNKTTCFGEVEPTWSHVDAAYPDLDSKQYNLLLQEAKAQAFVELKQQENTKAEQRARRGWMNFQRKKSNFPEPYYNNFPNYSRKG